MLNTSFSNKTQYLRNVFGFFYLLDWTRSNAYVWAGPGPVHEQWRCSPLFHVNNGEWIIHSPQFTLQNSRDREMQKKKKKKRKSRLTCVAAMSGWRSKRWRPVVNWGSCLAVGRRSFLFFLCFYSVLFPSLFLFYFLEESLRFWEVWYSSNGFFFSSKICVLWPNWFVGE